MALPGVGPATTAAGTGLGSVISRSTATSVIGGRCNGATRDGGMPGGGTSADDGAGGAGGAAGIAGIAGAAGAAGANGASDAAIGANANDVAVVFACAATAYALRNGASGAYGAAASTTHACVSTRSRRDRRATADGRIGLTSFSPRPWIQPWPLP